ncbi:M56 family metallopeptidase [Paludisphaera rhizosphaerae]|uniref:M56 family metallopeptidase n=1 Tax=Paludisphaera rhizosphaerae TaxID=2711216 RepID=UPI0013ED65EF|nr:M56 family metallopeptidase [Paludisphaera rhizosphaerae]
MGELLLTGGFAAVVARVTILLGLAIFVVLAMRRTSAATRHGVLASAAAASLAAPFLTLLGPTWSLPVLTPTVEPIAASSVPPAPAFDRFEPAMLPPRDATIGQSPARPILASPVLAPSPPWTWSQRLLAIWAAGAAVAAIPGVVVGVRLRRLARRSQPLAGPPWDAMLDDLRGRLGVRGRVQLIHSNAVAAPMTWGVFRPIVALPSDAVAWPEDRLRAVLVHELAHVARRDALAQVPARLACVIYWFHPLAWWTASRMLVERERACDDLVLAAGWRGVDYAQRLLEVAQGVCGRTGFAGVAAMAPSSQVEDRVRAILDASRNHRPLGRRGILALAAATTALAVPLTSARLVAQAAQLAAEAPKAETMTISGRVLDSEGKPVAGAKVVVVGRRWEPSPPKERKNELGEGVADGEGRFRIETPRTSSDRWYPSGNVVAGAPGFGLGWRAFDVDAAAPTVEVVLPPEEPTEFRFVTPEGQPVTGLVVRMLSLTRELPPAERPGPDLIPFVVVSLYPRVPDALASLWLGEWKTDEEGVIKVAGLGRGIMTSPSINDPRYVLDAAFVKAAPAEGSRRTRVQLSHALRISGLVKTADDGRPIPGATVKVTTRIDPTGSERSGKAQSDEQGRYAATIPPTSSKLEVTITPPLGSPYLTRFDEFPKPPDATPQTLDLTVPRGVLIEGRVVDREGRPIGNATITYRPERRDKPPWGPRNVSGSMAGVSSGADGRFAIAVAPGKGTVSVAGPTQDYALKEWTEANRQREYAHAFLPYDVQPGQAPVAMDAVLNPGATIVGRVDDPEGRHVARASIITAASFAGNRLSWGGSATIPVVDGRFAIPGATAGRLMRAWFFDAERGLGAMVDLDPDTGPVVVRLQPSGEARMRVVDLDGRPYASSGPRLSIVAAAGPPELHELEGIDLTAEELKQPLAEEAYYGLFDRRNYWPWPTFPKEPDADGRVVFPKLIPGATYRIYERVLEGDEATLRWRDFTVAPGQTIDLGDVHIEP